MIFSSDGGRFILPEYGVEPEEERLLVVVGLVDLDAARAWLGAVVVAVLSAGCDNGCVASGPLACGTGTGMVVERDGGAAGMGTSVVVGTVINGVCCTAG